MNTNKPAVRVSRCGRSVRTVIAPMAAAVCALVLTTYACLAIAQVYPTRPIRFVVPFPPGGGTDVIGRVVAQRLAPGLRTNVIVDNRGGADGIIGVETVAKAPPDGYTMLFMSSALASLPYFYKSVPFDPVRDLGPISLFGSNFGQALVVNPSLPVRSVKELIALAKTRPGQLDYGAAGTTRLAAELFNMVAGVKLNHIPYKGGGNAITDLVSGHIQVAFPAAQSVVPMVQAGRLRALAITGKQRWSELPGVPTIEEAGVKGFDLDTWYGLWFPAATPAEYVNRMQTEAAKAAQDPAAKPLFEKYGLRGVGSIPVELDKALREALVVMKRLTAYMGIVPQ